MNTVSEIIERAAMDLPTQFRTALIQQANMHADMIDCTSNARVRQSAHVQQMACLGSYETIGLIGFHLPAMAITARECAEQICNERNRSIIAFNVACKLLDIPAHERTAKIVDHFDAMGWSAES